MKSLAERMEELLFKFTPATSCNDPCDSHNGWRTMARYLNWYGDVVPIPDSDPCDDWSTHPAFAWDRFGTHSGRWKDGDVVVLPYGRSPLAAMQDSLDAMRLLAMSYPITFLAPDGKPLDGYAQRVKADVLQLDYLDIELRAASLMGVDMESLPRDIVIHKMRDVPIEPAYALLEKNHSHPMSPRQTRDSLRYPQRQDKQGRGKKGKRK